MRIGHRFWLRVDEEFCRANEFFRQTVEITVPVTCRAQLRATAPNRAMKNLTAATEN
jgi:hypothetical protein